MTSLQIIVCVFAFVHTVFEIFMNYLNYKSLVTMKNDQPDHTKELMEEEKWKTATDYSVAKTQLSMVQEFSGFLILIVVILYILPISFNRWNATNESGIMFSSFLCVGLLMFIQTPGILFEWFSQFRIEDRFGFNNSTLKLWMSDKLKESLLGLIIGSLLFALLIWLYRILSDWSDYWWLVAFLVFFVLQLSLMVIWPRFILPLFNKLSPLEEGELKSRLMTLAARTGFAANTIEVIDGSKRSSHSNAYFTGFGKFRRIVLYDTLVEQMKQDEIEAVLAHEIGHYKLGHIPKRLFFSFIFGLLAFWGLDYALSQKTIYSGLGLGDEYLGSLAVLLVAAALLLPCFTYWLSPLSNFFSRKHEFEADRFAADSMEDGGALINALTKLYQENLSHPIPHSLIVFFHYSHPPYFDRIRALKNFQK